MQTLPPLHLGAKTVGYMTPTRYMVGVFYPIFTCYIFFYGKASRGLADSGWLTILTNISDAIIPASF